MAVGGLLVRSIEDGGPVLEAAGIPPEHHAAIARALARGPEAGQVGAIDEELIEARLQVLSQERDLELTQRDLERIRGFVVQVHVLDLEPRVGGGDLAADVVLADLGIELQPGRKTQAQEEPGPADGEILDAILLRRGAARHRVLARVDSPEREARLELDLPLVVVHEGHPGPGGADREQEAQQRG